MKFLCVLALVLMSLNSVAAIYQSHDKAGNEIFSDIPSANSQQYFVTEGNEVHVDKTSSQDTKKSAKTNPKEDKGDLFVGYETFEIVSPANEENFHNQRQLNVVVNISPKLNPEHAIKLFLDGAPISKPVSATQFVIEAPERGQHKIMASVLNEKNEIIQSTNSVIFFVHFGTKSP